MVDIGLKVDFILADNEILPFPRQAVAFFGVLAERAELLLRPILWIQSGGFGVVVVEAYELYHRVDGLSQDNGKEAVPIVATPHTGLHIAAVGAAVVEACVSILAVDDDFYIELLVLLAGKSRGFGTLQHLVDHIGPPCVLKSRQQLHDIGILPPLGHFDVA